MASMPRPATQEVSAHIQKSSGAPSVAQHAQHDFSPLVGWRGPKASHGAVQRAGGGPEPSREPHTCARCVCAGSSGAPQQRHSSTAQLTCLLLRATRAEALERLQQGPLDLPAELMEAVQCYMLGSGSQVGLLHHKKQCPHQPGDISSHASPANYPPITCMLLCLCCTAGPGAGRDTAEESRYAGLCCCAGMRGLTGCSAVAACGWP